MRIRTVTLCFVGVVIWSASRAGCAEPRAAQAPAADIYTDVYNGRKWWRRARYRCRHRRGWHDQRPDVDRRERKAVARRYQDRSRGRQDKGMAAWDKLLDAKQMGQLYVYVRARADKVLPLGRPDEVGPNKGKWEPADWTNRPAALTTVVSESRVLSTRCPNSDRAWSLDPIALVVGGLERHVDRPAHGSHARPVAASPLSSRCARRPAD
jgi:hypothetical protein